MQIDPFTRASATYQNAMRYPHKSGAAWEGYSPRGAINWGRVASALACVAFWGALGLFVFILLSVRG